MKQFVCCILSFSLLLLSACNDGSAPAAASAGSSPAPVHKRYLASNVVFSGASLSRARSFSARALDDVDTSTKILASDIILDDNNSTRLVSTDLQTALNQEIAPNIETKLKGHTWTVSHKMMHMVAALGDAGISDLPQYGHFNTVDGSSNPVVNSDLQAIIDNSQVTFNSDGTFSIDSGCFGVIHKDACADMGHNYGWVNMNAGTSPAPSFQAVSDSHLMFTFQLVSYDINGNPINASSDHSGSWEVRTVQVLSTDATTVVLMGVGDPSRTIFRGQEVVVLTLVQ
jgi:hypothetical protein